MKFEWDESKNASNRRKHSVDFAEAASAFADDFSQTFHDTGHSIQEDRYATIGLSQQGRLLIVWHTERDGVVRLISARTATRSETRGYTDARK